MSVVLPDADMLTVVFAATGVVAMLNVDRVLPDGIETVVGGFAMPGAVLPIDTLNGDDSGAFRVMLLLWAVMPPTAEPCTDSHEMSTGLSVNVAFAVVE